MVLIRPVIRPPQQARAHETFRRVVAAGREILAEDGTFGFSLAAVSARAGVSIGSIYSRVDSIDGLFVVIHEHVMGELSARTAEIAALASRHDLSTDELIGAAVDAVWRLYRENEGELRAFILRAAADEYIRSRGVVHAAQLETAFVTALRPRAAEFAGTDPEAAVRAAFGIVFDTLSWDVAFGTDFASPDRRDLALRDQLVRVCILLLRTH